MKKQLIIFLFFCWVVTSQRVCSADLAPQRFLEAPLDSLLLCLGCIRHHSPAVDDYAEAMVQEDIPIPLRDEITNALSPDIIEVLTRYPSPAIFVERRNSPRR